MGLWLLLGLLVASVAVVVWVFRPGAGEAQDEAARQIFRNEEAPRKRVRPAPSKREIDEATQTETTGHEWDGIKELDTPMPRWWLWTLYATIVWGVIYTILFPAWPLVNGATPGLLGYSSRGRGRGRDRRGARRQRRARRPAARGGSRQRRERPRAPALRHRRRRRGLPQLLLAVPRRRRRRGGRALPEPARRRLALGRHRRRHPADRHPRHPLRGRPRHPLQPDAGLRATSCSPQEIDGLVAVRAVALRPGRATRRPPRRRASSSSTTAPPATARTAPAAASSARRT